MTVQTPRVLLATSGSAASRRASAVAADLASTFDAELVILHVLAPIEYRIGRLAPTLPITRRLDDPLTNAVLLDARRVAWARSARTKTILVAGDAARVIVTVAGELGADLLVIGSNPHRIASTLSARTRRWVHSHAPCPVLPVTPAPPTASPPAREPVLVT